VAFRFEMSVAPGEIQSVNNHVIYPPAPPLRATTVPIAAVAVDAEQPRPPRWHEVRWRAIEAGALRGGIGQSSVPV